MEFSVGTDGSEVRARNLQTCRSLVRESGSDRFGRNQTL
ncbi:hypothetical protein LSS_17640 [Leptospira santarosai serovar Shermani str. LT 821]|uniref:Uncharacterized protein n=1 Tax=Leptospira santarosai serovar Shermani str. LT 821 TaxID=758847 RepID=K8XX42_9LEPT|nr:hypothetical protein LSS_17640 [Leptospira santarosai serovar Shermani str. LT 821]